MAAKNKKNAAEDLIESLMRDLQLDEAPIQISEETSEIPVLSEDEFSPATLVGLVDESRLHLNSSSAFDDISKNQAAVVSSEPSHEIPSESTQVISLENVDLKENEMVDQIVDTSSVENSEATLVLNQISVDVKQSKPFEQLPEQSEVSDISEKTVAVTGFHQRKPDDFQDKVRVSVGQSKSAHSAGYASWGGNNVDVNLAQAENLRIAQDKILQLEKDNEKLRLQNEELISASEIIKERSDLIGSQLRDLKNDREDLEQSYRNEIALLKGHIQKKEADLDRAQMKNDELDSRLKFDMKKIRIRERELENRLELIRAEKNAIVKTKDDQILDLRRKMDILQMEADSYRQKCNELNKAIETNQDSFKRTVRALRLAMANLELTEENKVPVKKAE